MKKWFSVFFLSVFTLAIVFPLSASAKSKKATKRRPTAAVKAHRRVPTGKPLMDIPIENYEPADSCIGKEVVFATQDMKAASFSPDEAHALKHDLHYVCPACRCITRAPGRCTCLKAFVPAIRHGDSWLEVTRETGGLLTIGKELFQSPAPSEPSKSKSSRKSKSKHKARKAKVKSAKSSPAGIEARPAKSPLEKPARKKK